ncbi:NAD(P)/FAD-dependent oxidoreductase [soil metagenome]
MILDANDRLGHAWRSRWDSLRAFTPARYCGLDGMAFPAPPHHFPTKEEVADYLEAYAAQFDLPVRLGMEVDRLFRKGDTFMVAAGDRLLEANNVVVAMGSFQEPRVPGFASELDRGIVQFHSSRYQRSSQLQPGGVLVVGAGNSGSEIALDVVAHHRTWLAGADTGHVPFRIEGVAARYLLVPLVLRVLFHRVLTTGTPIGRRARPRVLARGGPLVRTKPKDIIAAGVERVPWVIGVEGGLPALDDGRTLDAANVVWATGYNPGFSWIDLDVMDEADPIHDRGIVTNEPGLFFVGLEFLYSLSSEQIHGVGRDAAHIAHAIAVRRTGLRPIQAPSGARGEES